MSEGTLTHVSLDLWAKSRLAEERWIDLPLP